MILYINMYIYIYTYTHTLNELRFNISVAQVDTCLSDEEIVAKALSEHLKQVAAGQPSSRNSKAWRDQEIRWLSKGCKITLV